MNGWTQSTDVCTPERVALVALRGTRKPHVPQELKAEPRTNMC